MSAAVSLQCAVSLAEAKRLVDDRTVDPLLRAAANSIISLYAVIKLYEEPWHVEMAANQCDYIVCRGSREPTLEVYAYEAKKSAAEDIAKRLNAGEWP